MKRQRMGAIARYFGMLLLLAVLYAASGSRQVLALMGFSVLLIPISLLAALAVRGRLDASLALPTTFAKRGACMGTLTIRNTSIFPAANLTCAVRLHNDLTDEQVRIPLSLSLAAKRSGSRDFFMESEHCGRIYAEITDVRIYDWFGIFCIRTNASAQARMTIVPDLFSCEVQMSCAAAQQEQSSDYRRGDDRTEVFGFHNYQNGDDVRAIHWKLSSKLDTLLVREPSGNVSRSVLLLWDKRNACSAAAMDAMAEAAASVARGLCESAIAFDLGWTEKEDFLLSEIGNMDALLQAIPALVTRSALASAPEPDTHGYAQVIRITACPPGSENEGRETVLLCAENDENCENCVVFTTENYEKILERLEL